MRKLIILVMTSILAVNPYLYLNNVTNAVSNKEQAVKNIDKNYQAFLSSLNRTQKIQYKNTELNNVSDQLIQKQKIVFNNNLNNRLFIKQSVKNDFNIINKFQNNHLNFIEIIEGHNRTFLNSHHLQIFTENVKVFKTKITLNDFEKYVVINKEIDTTIINHSAIKKQIEKIINNYFIINCDEEELLPIINYLNFLKQYKSSYYVDTLNRIVCQFNEFEKQLSEEDNIKQYISKNMWNDYKVSIQNESQPLITGDSINGWNLVANDYLNYFAKGLGTSIFWNIAQRMIFKGKTLIGIGFTKLIAWLATKGVEISTTGIGAIVIAGILAYFMYGQIKASIFANKLLSNKVQDYVRGNKKEIVDLYGFSTGEQFEQFLNNGFSVGFLSKLGSLFGAEAIKDRAYMIYDPQLNRNWVVDKLKISSEAHLRNWIGVPYQRNNQTTIYVSNQEKTFYIAMNGVKVPFVRTYYGPIMNSYKNHYILEQGINWLTHTSLKITPSFSKLSLNSIKNRFVYETYNAFINQKEFYRENYYNLGDSILKNHIKNMLNLSHKPLGPEKNNQNGQIYHNFSKKLYELYN